MISVAQLRWGGILAGIIFWSILLTTLTLLQLNLRGLPAPWLLLDLWHHGFYAELVASVCMMVVMGMIAWLWYRGGYQRWISYYLILAVVVMLSAISGGLCWFNHQTSLHISMLPWAVVFDGTLLFSNKMLFGLLVRDVVFAILGSFGATLVLLLLASRRETTLGDARFANPYDIQHAKLYDSEGVVLGKSYGKELRVGGFESVLVVAPTGSGKTTAIAIPNLLTWKDSAVVNDLKGELYRKTQLHREKQLQQTCYYWSPASHSEKGHRYNPFAYVRMDDKYHLRDLQFIAQVLIQRESSEQAFWPVTSRELFVMCAFYAFATEKTCTLAKLHDLARREDFILWLEYELINRTIEDPLFYQYAASITQCDEKTRGNIIKDFHARLDVFSDPLIRDATSGNDFDLRELRRKKMSIYINIPDSDKSRLQGVLTLFWAQLIALMTQKEPDLQEEPLGVLMVMDEFGNLDKIPQLKSGVSFLRSYRLRALMMVQYLGQIVSAYGQTDAKAFLNSKIKCTFSLNDMDDAKYFAESMGKKTIRVQNRSVSMSHGEQAGSASHSTNLQAYWLMSPDRLMRLPRRQLVLLVEGCFPIYGRKVHF
jgi:type IV secretion system protein VirD4